MVSNYLLKTASKFYEFDENSLTFISSSTNEIYKFQKCGKWYILRFSNRSSVQLHHTRAEMDWLYYLAHNGINVSLPLRAANGEMVSLAEEDGNVFIISAYESLTGDTFKGSDSLKWNDPLQWDTVLFHNWGKLMGDMHRVTMSYKPANATDVPDTFTGHESFLEPLKSSPKVYKKLQEIREGIDNLPKDIESFGLIHGDLHPWNVMVDGDHISPYDFDDCAYSWYTHDIGIALYHGLWWGYTHDAGQDYTDKVVYHFINGYKQANTLSEFWVTQIPMFMHFRQICNLSWFYNPDMLDDTQKKLIQDIEEGLLLGGIKVKL